MAPRREWKRIFKFRMKGASARCFLPLSSSLENANRVDLTLCTKREYLALLYKVEQAFLRFCQQIFEVYSLSVKVKQPSDILVISSAIDYPQKRKITQSADELKKLKIADLVQLLDDLTGHQLEKPRKPDLTSKTTEVAILRSN